MLLFALGVIAANTHIAHGWIPVTAYEADVNKDTRVNSGDLGAVASKFGQPVPTATPTAVVPAPPTIVRNRAWGYLSESQPPATQLLDTSNGTVVRDYPGWNLPHLQSCDGLFSVLQSPSDLNTLHVVNNLSGAVIFEGTFPLYRAWFPCPLKGVGAAVNATHLQSDRLIVQYNSPPPNDGAQVRIYDLASGSILYDNFFGSSLLGSGPALTCNQDAVLISTYSSQSLVRLLDGSVTSYNYLYNAGLMC